MTPGTNGFCVATLRIVVPIGARVGERVLDHLVLPVPVKVGTPAKKGKGEGTARFGVTLRLDVESSVAITVR